MTSPFSTETVKPLPANSLLRAIRPPSPGRARASLRTVFATRSPSSVTSAEIAAILSAYRIWWPWSPNVRRSLLREAFSTYLDRGGIDAQELAFCQSVATALDLAKARVAKIFDAVAGPRIFAAVREALSEDPVSETSLQEFREFCARIPISEARRNHWVSAAAERTFEALARPLIARGRMTPGEEANLTSLASGLQLPSLPVRTATLAKLVKARTLWEIENGHLPIVSVDVNLAVGEVAHLVCRAEWHEYRTVTDRVDYHGTSASFRIVKGVRYRAGSYRAHRVTHDELTKIDEGPLVITNRRLIFEGGRKVTSIRWSGVLSIVPHSKGVVLEKTAGKRAFLYLTGDLDIACAIITEALARS